MCQLLDFERAKLEGRVMEELTHEHPETDKDLLTFTAGGRQVKLQSMEEYKTFSFRTLVVGQVFDYV